MQKTARRSNVVKYAAIYELNIGWEMMEQVANAILAELGSRVRAWRARRGIKGRPDEAKFADHIELVPFRRSVGSWAGVHTNPHGTPISTAEFDAKKDH